jgi:hypothetical protein
MNKIIFAVAALITAFVMVYLAIAFIVWELDPSQWNQIVRFVFVQAGVGFGGIAAFLVKENT